jgi:hypothetical protein
VAMVWFAFTGFCILANVLYWSGAEPRLTSSDHKAAADVDGLAGHRPYSTSLSLPAHRGD